MQPLSTRERYESLGAKFKAMVYELPDGSRFTIERPCDLPHNVPYAGRAVSLAEYLAICNFHSKPEAGLLCAAE